MPPPRLPPLMDELVEEVLLRLPPERPASLVRAGLVCKRWCCLISAPRFRRRFRDFHRSPPMLGFLYSYRSSGDEEGRAVTRLLPTSASTCAARTAPDSGCRTRATAASSSAATTMTSASPSGTPSRTSRTKS
ncbi:hypothetical protein U9M48_002101 [Paspalum notatum var. saurae]|uniref:F-box domain-containing protein n=1 Tax=Paspalum notatum var. saurae TaxID=547442 RepID=A0AAQ3PGN1_PASNO